jgi:hypothetical protein
MNINFNDVFIFIFNGSGATTTIGDFAMCDGNITMSNVNFFSNKICDGNNVFDSIPS